MKEQRHSDVRLIVARNIRRVRKRQGLSLRKFALMIDMSYTYLCNVENAKQALTIDALDKIARGLDIEISELFERHE